MHLIVTVLLEKLLAADTMQLHLALAGLSGNWQGLVVAPQVAFDSDSFVGKAYCCGYDAVAFDTCRFIG